MTLAALTILGPLAAVALILVLRRGAPALALLGTGAALAGALVTLVRVAGGARYAATLPGLPDLPLRLVVEPLTAVLAALVAVVSFFVMVYAVGYTAGEGGKARFFSVMSLFAAAMQTLVLAGDWVLLLAAWEVIGFASFLLIGFYFGRPGVGQAASRAFLYTRSADLGLYVAIFVLISRTGTSEISATLGVGGAAAVVVGLFLLLAAMGKSAQTPFHGWLLDAMAGPTPVSALLHSATLVAAGAVLLIRAFPLLPPAVLVVVGVAGGLTALVTGLTALAQRDLKRLLAASTASQYGLMLLAVGAGSPVADLFHLLAHAATKSSLFLGAGVFQHAAGGSTELADLEGLGRARRRVFLAFVVSGLALAGVNHLAVLRSFFQTISRRLELPDPTRSLDEVRFHQKTPKRSYLTKREAEVLLSTIEKRATTATNDNEELASVGSARKAALDRALAARDHAAICAMIYAGLRIEETTALGTGDVSFARGEEQVRVAKGKGNKERVVPMSPKLKRSLRRYLKVREELALPGQSPPSHLFLNEKGGRVTENTVRRRLYGWVRKSRLKKADVKPHDLRRTFGTWYLQENPGHVRELAELMGHSDLSQVMKYALSDEKRARAGVARL